MTVKNDRSWLSISGSSDTTTKNVEHSDLYCVHMLQLIVGSGSASMQVQASLDGGTTWTDLLSSAVSVSGDIAIVQGRYPKLRASVAGTSFTGTVAISQYGSGPGEVL